MTYSRRNVKLFLLYIHYFPSKRYIEFSGVSNGTTTVRSYVYVKSVLAKLSTGHPAETAQTETLGCRCCQTRAVRKYSNHLTTTVPVLSAAEPGLQCKPDGAVHLLLSQPHAANTGPDRTTS